MEPLCLFCLDPVKQDALQNPIGCHCTIVSHTKCFDVWFQQKQQMECPICHTVSLPSDVQVENIRIVFIDTTHRERIERHHRMNKKAAAFCCCLLLGFGIGFSILDYIKNT